MAEPVIWEVTGGADKGGILVRKGRELKSEEASERLSTGALVQQLELENGRLRYLRLTGCGPRQGWVSMKLKDKALVVPATKPPPQLPVLACFYSGGFTADFGRMRLEPLQRHAREAGILDTVVMDHFGEPGFDDCKDFDDYISRLEAVLDADPRLRGRPVAIFAHSHGCVGGYGLARRLGRRCLKFYAVARRPPDGGLLDDVWGVDSGPKLEAVSDEALLSGMLDAWPNDRLERFRSARPLPDPIKDTLQVMRRQYSSSVVPLGSADAPGISRRGGAPLTLEAPVLALAAAGELPAGETAEKMAAWRDFAGGDFELRTLEGTHMGIAGEQGGELFELVVSDVLELALPSAPLPSAT